MARTIARGVESVDSITSTVRTVDSDLYKDSDDMIVTKDDLEKCSGMIIGSPTHFGNMASLSKHF